MRKHGGKYKAKEGGTLKLYDSTGLENSGVSVVKEAEEGCRTKYRVNYPDGCGNLTVFSVFPGAKLVFDNFEVTNCYCGIQQGKNVIQINYCLEGRSECELQNGFYRYLGRGDLSVTNLSNHAIQMGFPLGYYKGVDIIIYMDELSDPVLRFLPGVSLDISSLRDRLCAGDGCFVMRARDTVEHMFLDLYNIPPSIQPSFFGLKILELLLYLSAIDVSSCNERREYFPKQLAQTVKKIKTKITSDPGNRYTVEALAEEYGISRTALKSCFKGIYGASIGEFMKNYRMQKAAALLTETNRSVLSICECVGYENQSRFAAAFKSVMGKSPLVYRKSVHSIGKSAVHLDQKPSETA